MAQGLPSGSPGTERIRTFVIDGIELKGDVSPPIRSEQHIARSFQRVDGNGTVELWWCWNCGRQNGMWKKHQTYDCPHRNTPGTQSNSLSLRSLALCLLRVRTLTPNLSAMVFSLK